ncbi:MAG: S41 family peptidase, partial [Candidatus Muirbacterium halophilum]|nr:S41 family peptidase [Candidatus Muirbacterium halophilum]
MKKTLYFICILTLFVILTFSQQIPEKLKPYIQNINTNSKYIELKVPDWNNNIPDSITKSQALEDIKIFEYIISEGYSGYDYWKNQGCEFDKTFSELKDFINTLPDTFETWNIERAIAQTLYSLNILDGHLSVRGYNYSKFFNHKSAYFSEIILKKTNSKFIVKESNIPSVKIGDIYNDKEEYLFKTLPSNGIENYIIGLLSYQPVVIKEIKFSSGSFLLPFHTCKISETNISNDIFTDRKVLNTPVISVRTMSYKYNDILKEFEKTGYKYKKSENIILDILYNGGGSSDYGMNFIKNLNKVAIWRMSSAKLESPATLQAWAWLDINENPTLKDIIIYSKNQLKKQKESPYRKFETYDFPEIKYGDFKGNLFVLTNRNIASSGEALCSYSKSVKNSLLIGENTAGIGTFGEINEYQLPNSNIILNIPEKLFVQSDVVESIGFIPDYWLDSANPVEELVRYINFPSSYNFSYSNLIIPKLKNIDMEVWKDNIPEGLYFGDGAFTGNKNNNIIKKS